METTHIRRESKPGSHGFTLVELLVVIMVISVLTALTMGVIRFARYAAKRAHAKAEIEELHKVLLNHQLTYGKFPNVLEDVRSKLQEGFMVTNTAPGYTGSFFVLDPWFAPYRYSLKSAASYELYSMGPKVAIADDDIFSGK